MFHAEMMGDIMYYDQVFQQPDVKQFANAIVKEVNGHVNSKHWTLVKQKEFSKEAQVVLSVWAMRCKRGLTTNKIIKHKARMNLHGGKQVYGMNYFNTYCACCHLVCHQAHDRFWHHILLGHLAS
jgi:hypothetical protein